MEAEKPHPLGLLPQVLTRAAGAGPPFPTSRRAASVTAWQRLGAPPSTPLLGRLSRDSCPRPHPRRSLGTTPQSNSSPLGQDPGTANAECARTNLSAGWQSRFRSSVILAYKSCYYQLGHLHCPVPSPAETFPGGTAEKPRAPSPLLRRHRQDSAQTVTAKY